jgi:hypothetical protein
MAARKARVERLHTRQLVEELFEDDLHARRVVSLANGVTGVLRAATLSIHAIGEGYAEVARTKPRSAPTSSRRMGGARRP